MTTTNCSVQIPHIRRLTIDRYRGIKHMVWHPQPGLNVVLGGGDVGKTTVLDAVALLLSPTNAAILTDADYWCRDFENGFCVEAVMSLPESCGINQQTKNAWPWEWDGTEPKLPTCDSEAVYGNNAESVYRLRVRGTPEFDLVFEVVQPDGTTDHLAVAVRRGIGLVRLSGDDRNDRDLRLVQGSALERLLSDKTLRARLSQGLAKTDIEDGLRAEARTHIQNLDEAFQKQALPTGLGLGLTGSQGISISALIGLTATKDCVKLPLTSWGAGTRRLAALEIAAVHQGEHPITLVDEVERGLEPYRQRILLSELQERGSQVFLTTHSAAVISAASSATFWYIDSANAIGRLPNSVDLHRSRDPETFLARIAIVAEGATEVGFVRSILERAIDNDLLRYGIWVTDGCGNDHTLKLLEGLACSGLVFGGFADDEGRDLTSWERVRAQLGDLLFRWPKGCIEENIIQLLPIDTIDDFIKDTDGDSGERLRTLAERLEISEKDYLVIKSKAPDLKSLIIEAATGSIPDNKKDAERGEKKALKKHAEKWFKNVEGGRELADKVFAFGLWPQLKGQLLPFINAVRTAVSLSGPGKLT